MSKKTILLVEDNSNDEFLTLRALKKYNVANDVIVVDQDGARLIQSLSASPGRLGVRLVWPLPSAAIRKTAGYPSRALMNTRSLPFGAQAGIWLSGGALVRRRIAPLVRSNT